MRRSNFALRLQPSLMEEARKAAESEGVALNQLINVAVAEKVSALRTEEYFRARSRRANRAQTLRILSRAGKGNPPMEGDELPVKLRRNDAKTSRRPRRSTGAV
jgi:HicB family